MSWVSCAVEWIECHPVVSTFILAGLAGIGTWIYRWNESRIKLNIRLSLGSFKSSTNSDRGRELVFGFKIRIANTSKNPVTISEFYLQMPNKLRKIDALTRVFPGSLDFENGVRMYQNNFNLSDETGLIKNVPFDLGRVDYLFGELPNPEITKHLDGKWVRFVVIDQKQTSHYSNKFKLDSDQILKNLKKYLR